MTRLAFVFGLAIVGLGVSIALSFGRGVTLVGVVVPVVGFLSLA